MHRLFLAVAASVLLCHSALGAEVRKWTDTTGKFKVDAEFVSLNGQTVRLKRADNGRVIDVPLGRLSDGDRAVATRLSQAASTSSGTANAAKDIKLSASMKWSERVSFSQDGKELPRDLQLVVEAKGKLPADATEFGFTKLDSIKATSGAVLKLKKEEFSFRDLSSKFTNVVRSEEAFLNQHPEGGVRVTFDLERPSKAIQKISAAKGSLKIKSGGERKMFKIEKAASKIDKPLANQEFAELGVKATIKKDGDSLALHLDGKHSAIYKVELKSPTGGKLPGEVGSGHGGGGRLKQYSFFFDGDIPSNATFFVYTAKNTKEIEIPFEFSNLKIPKEPKGFGN